MNQLKNILVGILYGMKDAFVGITAIYRIHKQQSSQNSSQSSRKPTKPGDDRKPKRRQINVIHRIAQCCALNGGVFGASILIFHYGLLPWLYTFMMWCLGSQPALVSQIWFWLSPLLSITFNALWVLPLFCICRLVNALWFQDIADTAFDRPPSNFSKGLSMFIADFLFSLLIEALFLVQATAVAYIPFPFIAHCASIFHLSLLYALYSFEYKWFNMGWELHRRLNYIETNWAYFLGFGLPLTLCTSLSQSYFINGCIFSILFPFFIISGNEAVPVAGLCDKALQLFSPVVWISNKIFHSTIYLSGTAPSSTGGTSTSSPSSSSSASASYKYHNPHQQRPGYKLQGRPR